MEELEFKRLDRMGKEAMEATGIRAKCVTVLIDGFGGLTDLEFVVPAGLGVAALSFTLWWRNAYVVTRSIRWTGDLALLVSSVVGVSLAMIAAAWIAERDPARLFQLLLTGGWLVNLAAFRLILARRGDVRALPPGLGNSRRIDVGPASGE